MALIVVASTISIRLTFLLLGRIRDFSKPVVSANIVTNDIFAVTIRFLNFVKLLGRNKL